MSKLTRTQNSVAFHLLKAVFILYFLFTFVLTVSHMALEYRNTKNAVIRELALVQQSFSQGLSTALFELNEEQLRAIVNGMVTLPAVTGVQIETVGSSVQMSDALGTVINAQNEQINVSTDGITPNNDALFWQDFTIYFHDSELVLGKGRIYSSNAVVYAQVKGIFVIILGGAVLKTAALWFLFLWAARSRLNRPITVLASVMDAMKINSDERIDIDIKPAAKKGKTEIQFDLAGRMRDQIEVHTDDEIHRLTSSFQSLTASTQRKLQGLNLLSETAASLIKLNEADAILAEVSRTLARRYPVTGMLALLNVDESLPGQTWHWQASDNVFRLGPPASAAMIQQSLLAIARIQTLPASLLTELPPAAAIQTNSGQVVGLPLVDADHRLGVLLFAIEGEPMTLAPEDLAFLGALSRLLVIALKNAQMLEVIREQSRTLEQQVNQRTEQLQRAVKELESFNYAVSHDLRAPLRHVNGFLQMLTDDLPPQNRDKLHPLVERMQAALQRMRDMIDGMLKLAGTGHTSPRSEPVSLTPLVEEIITELPEEVRARTRFEVAELGMVLADRTLLRQVLQNLIENAVKYAGKSDSPQVWIEPHSCDGPSQLTVMVRDNGVGFDPQYADKLFKLFQRLHRPEDFPGTGVGLAVCAKIIQLHGGRIWAESTPNQGARFYFTIPAAPAMPALRRVQ